MRVEQIDGRQWVRGGQWWAWVSVGTDVYGHQGVG